MRQRGFVVSSLSIAQQPLPRLTDTYKLREELKTRHAMSGKSNAYRHHRQGQSRMAPMVTMKEITLGTSSPINAG